MIRCRLLFFALFLLAGGLLSPHAALAQSLRMRTDAPRLQKEPSPWSGDLGYSVTTDYAETVSPRSYIHALFGDVNYAFDSRWTLGLQLGIRAETIDGSIPKEAQESHTETISPSTALELDFSDSFFHTHKYTLFLHGEPLWDEASRLEGYKGLYGAGADLTLRFFHRFYSLSQTVDVTSLVNTFAYAADATANPDYFYTYKLVNALHFWGSYRVAYTFGLKVTRYMDDFWGYSYNNVFSVSKTWQDISLALAYSNGGFTDDGRLSLWYIDQYRRVAQLVLNYSF